MLVGRRALLRSRATNGMTLDENCSCLPAFVSRESNDPISIGLAILPSPTDDAWGSSHLSLL